MSLTSLWATLPSDAPWVQRRGWIFGMAEAYLVRIIRGAWDKLTKTAKLPGLLFHDMRRSAVRNTVRKGLPEVVARRISGHKTRIVFDRYNIVNKSALVEAAKRIERGSSRESGHTLGTANGAEQFGAAHQTQKPFTINRELVPEEGV
jgi:hypothetical protein